MTKRALPKLSLKKYLSGSRDSVAPDINGTRSTTVARRLVIRMFFLLLIGLHGQASTWNYYFFSFLFCRAMKSSRL
jgi:hypothetical protein